MTGGMNESELRDGLRAAVAANPPPPSMSATTVLDAARQAHRRRRAAFGGAGAVAAVVAITVGATVALSSGGSGQVGAGGPTVERTEARPTATPGPDTETTWPTGPDGLPQQDRTATAGPRHDVGARLLDELVAVVPTGYTVPERTPEQSADGTGVLTPENDVWVRYHQAQFVDRVGGAEVWEYLASLAVSGAGGTGRLYSQVTTAGNTLPDDPCGLTTSLWGLAGECQVVDVGGQRIGVVVRATDPSRHEFDQWAAYRHPDGTVVHVAQSQRYRDTTAPPLPAPLFTVPQLAELAMADRFLGVG